MSQRRVLVLSYYCPPAASAGVYRTLRFVRYLPEFGWQPLVVTVSPEALHHQRRDSSLDRLMPEDTVVARTTVWRPWESTARMVKSLFGGGSKTVPEAKANVSQPAKSDGTPPKRSRLMRTADAVRDLLFETPDAHIGWMVPAIRAALPLVRQFRPEAIYSSGPPHSSHLIAVVLRRLTGIPTVIDFRDPWARTEWDDNACRSVRGTAQRWLEQICVSAADRAILNTGRLRDEFQTSYRRAFRGKFRVITNGYDPELRIHVEKLLAETTPASPSDVVRLCHPGAIYGRRTLRHLVAAIGELVGTGRRVVMEQIGGIGEAAELLRYASEHLPPDCLQLLGQLPHDQTLSRMAAADILVVVQPDTSIQIPGKLFEMMPFRKPLLALTQQGATADVIERFGLGIVVDPNDPQAIASAISKLADDWSSQTETAEWDKALGNFDGRHLTGKLAGVLDELV